MKVPKKWKARAFIDKDEYEKLYRKSVEKPDKFWGKEGKRIDWIKPYTRVKNTSFAYPDISIRWFEDGTLNVAANCIDRHLKKRGKQVAIIWEPDDPAQEARHITYRELHGHVCRLANVLKANGVKTRRPRHHLPADDPGSGLRHARLRAHRRHSFRRVRRLFAGFARGPHRRLQVESSDHGRRGSCAAAAKCRSRPMPTKRSRRWAASTRFSW